MLTETVTITVTQTATAAAETTAATGSSGVFGVSWERTYFIITFLGAIVSFFTPANLSSPTIW